MSDEASIPPPAGSVTDLERALAAQRQHLGDGDPATLSTLLQLASARYTCGDLDGARRDVDEVYRARVDALGPDHPDTLFTRHTAITIEDNAGADPAETLLSWVRLSADEQRVLGSTNQLALSARFGVARARRALHDITGARDEALCVTAAQRRVLGDRHPDTLQTWTSLATWRGEAGNLRSALEDLDELVPLLQDVLGHDHVHTLTSRHTRALWTPTETSVLERLSEWEVLYEDETRALGPANPLTVDAALNVDAGRAQWVDWLKETHDLAADLYADFEIAETGADVTERGWADLSQLHEDSRVRVLGEAGNVDAGHVALLESITAAKRNVSLAGRTFGNDSEHTLVARYDLARAFWDGEDEGFAAAQRYATRLVDDSTRLLGERHPLTEAAGRLRDHAGNRTVGYLPPYRPDAHRREWQRDNGSAGSSAAAPRGDANRASSVED